MKRKRSLGMAAAVCAGSMLISAPVLADSSISVAQKTLYEFSGEYSSDTGYFFAKLENTSEDAVTVGYGKLVAFSENDDILLTKEYISPAISSMTLNPGEYIYVSEFLWDTALEDADVSDYKFSTETKESGSTIGWIPCEADWNWEGSDSYENDVFVTFTNTTGDQKYDFYITAALYDAEENLIFVDSYCISTLAVHPDSTVTVKLDMDSKLVEYYEQNGIVPASVDAQVYYKISE